MTIWTTKAVAQQRYDICKSCEHFILVTNQCDLCKCFMKLKVKIKNSKCPADLWEEDLSNMEFKDA